MKKGLIIIIFFANYAVFGQLPYAQSILKTLCSDFFAGRGYVEDGADKAASFLIKELKNEGISSFPGKSYAQNYEFDVNTFPNEISVNLNGRPLEIGVDYLINPNSGSSVGNYLLEKVNPMNIDAKLASLKNENRLIALVFDNSKIVGRDSVRDFYMKAIKACRYVPVIWPEKNKLMYSVGRNHMKNAFIQLNQDKVKYEGEMSLNVTSKFEEDFRNTNVIGFIEGKKKKKYIVITGHYDHLGKMGQAIFPGANDNASGVAMMLSLAKHFKKVKPKYSIVLIFFSGEEAGLEGSRYFVRHPFFGLNRVKFLLNIDILGSASEGITAVNGTVHKKHFKLLTKLNNKFNYLPLIKKRGPTQNSDHYYFSQTGVPSFFVYSMGNCKNYHDINDRAENTSLDNFDNVMSLFIKFIQKL